MKHTPGPWRLQYTQDNSEFTGMVVSDSRTIADTATAFWLNRGIESEARLTEANARLIAAAPELLTACELALGVITVLNRDLTEGGTIRILEDAIRKATQAD